MTHSYDTMKKIKRPAVDRDLWLAFVFHCQTNNLPLRKTFDSILAEWLTRHGIQEINTTIHEAIGRTIR